MPDSIEQRLMELVVARMQTILIADGFQTDIGTTVEDSRPNWDQEDDLPAISVFQGTTRPIEDESDDEQVMVTRSMPVMIKCFFTRSDDAATAAAFARKAIKDIYDAIATDKQWADDLPLALRTEETSHGIEYAENSFEITGVQVNFVIVYLTHYLSMD